MTARIETHLTRTYGVAHPIVQAPMAFVSTDPQLAIAVCQAGGIGSLAIGPLPAPAVRALIHAVRAATDAPFNVNFITFLTDEAQIAVCVEERVPIVSFHWGQPPDAFIHALHNAGSKVWAQVGSVEAARAAVDAGVDVIIAQGSEAGGHNYGSLPTFVLVPAIIQAVAPTPVLAAGGVATGQQLAAALALGAAGVSVGTRFVASVEAFAHATYRAYLLAASSTQTRLTAVYGPDLPHFNPMRVLDVGLARKYAGREDTVPRDLEAQPLIGEMQLAGHTIGLHRFTSFVPTPATVGQIEEMPFLAGQGVGLISDIVPVAVIIERLIADARATLATLGGGS
jgi:NAD(P)H-dependent flavin oxidoreductase YrpB (nitropropane dioxygenase family)